MKINELKIVMEDEDGSLIIDWVSWGRRRGGPFANEELWDQSRQMSKSLGSPRTNFYEVPIC